MLGAMREENMLRDSLFEAFSFWNHKVSVKHVETSLLFLCFSQRLVA